MRRAEPAGPRLRRLGRRRRENTDPRFGGALDAFQRSLAMAKDTLDADVVHCHTWYTHMGGFLAKQLWDVPLVLTTHSLEPLRPWKVEQLGNAYGLSAWIERTAIESADAVIAVSQETRNDVLRHFAVAPERVHVIHNGIDLEQYRPDPGVDALVRHGVDPDRPYVLFVGRITRQKGIIHLVNAIPAIDPSLQVVLCAGAPDTPEIGEEMAERVAEVERRPRRRDLDPRDGPAAGGDPALLARGRLLLPVGLRAVRDHQPRGDGLRDRRRRLGGRRDPRGRRPGRDRPPGRPRDPPGDLRPGRPGALLRRPRRGDQPGRARSRRSASGSARAGRRRVEEHFSWAAIARQTMDLYRSLVAGG